MREYKVEWESVEQREELLRVVKNGDRVTYLGMWGGDAGPDYKANTTVIWCDETDRPQEAPDVKFHNYQYIVYDVRDPE